MIHARLKRETAELHGLLEARLDLLGPGLTTSRYTRVLEVFHGFYAPLEERLASRIPPLRPPRFPLRDRTALLARDLLVLGRSPAEIAALPRCADLPELARSTHLAGCLYVIEGASLGGQVVARALRARLGTTRESGASFFAGDGPGIAARWRDVLSWIDELSRSTAGEESSDEIVASARATFLALTRWANAQGALT